MRRAWFTLFSLLLLWPFFLFTGEAAAPQHAVLLNIDGPIGPATSDYVHRGFNKAQSVGASLIILRMDTPGGLDSAMRRIIQDILGSTVPVVAYVAPSGARAASAGAYILLASHVAAMAPATNVGAATPVNIGGLPAPPSVEPKNPEPNSTQKNPSRTDKPGMEEKIINDAVAYIRSLAQMRGRNVEWAERAVREAASLSVTDALAQNVVDLVATDLSDLMNKIDERKIHIAGREIVIKTQGADIQPYDPDWRNRLLSVIADPNIAYILLLLGVYGLFFELWNPGFVLPGVIGGICLIMALYSFQVLPVNFAGLGLIVLGIGFMVAEAFVPSFGTLGIGGVIAFVAGSIVLMDTSVEGFAISWPLIAVVSLLSAAFFISVVTLALRARRRRVVTGKEEILGASGIALEDFKDTGRVRVHSEDWLARAQGEVRRGQKVRVIAIDGLTLTVELDSTEGK